MNILYINPIGEAILLFIIKEGVLVKTLEIGGKVNFDTFPEHIVEVVEIESIEELWCICGPGQFTRMRIVTLTLSTIAHIKKIPVKGCHFFDLIKEENPIIQANDREYIIRGTSTPSTIIDKDILPNGSYKGYGKATDLGNGARLCIYKDEIDKIIPIFASISSEDKLTPIYLKNPHITT